MNIIYYLNTCSTCQRILNELDPPSSYLLQDIKTEPVSPAQLEELRSRAGSYEALFNKRARLYRERGLHDKSLGEPDFAKLILDHYTFLRRPVIVSNDTIFIGNSKNTVAAAKESLHP
jgi:arsenate reductase